VSYDHDENDQDHENQENIIDADQPDIDVETFIEDLAKGLSHVFEGFLNIGIFEKFKQIHRVLLIFWKDCFCVGFAACIMGSEYSRNGIRRNL